MMITKQCAECGARKQAAEFLADNRTSDGLAKRCKDCAAGVVSAPAELEPEALADVSVAQPDSVAAISASPTAPAIGQVHGESPTTPPPLTESSASSDRLLAFAARTLKSGRALPLGAQQVNLEVVCEVIAAHLRQHPEVGSLFTVLSEAQQALNMFNTATRTLDGLVDTLSSKSPN